MAIGYLNPGDTMGVYNSGTFYGSSGRETLLINDGAGAVTVSPSIERMDFAGSSSDFTFRSAGGSLEVLDAAGAAVVARITVGSGQQIRFADGGMAAGADAETGALTLNGAVLDTKAAAFSGTVDASLKGALPDPTLAPDPKPDPKPDPAPTPDPDPKPDPTPDPEPEPDPEPQTFTLTGAPNSTVQGTIHDDIYDGTLPNSLTTNVKVVDPSGTDHDRLDIVLNRTNHNAATGDPVNGPISNIEDIQVWWDGSLPTATAPTFNAANIAHNIPGGAVVTVNNKRADIQEIYVTGIGAGTVVAGRNVSQTFIADGLTNGGTVDVGSASTLEIREHRDITNVRVEKEISLVYKESDFVSDKLVFHTDGRATVNMEYIGATGLIEKVGDGDFTLNITEKSVAGKDQLYFESYSGIDHIVLTKAEKNAKLIVNDGQDLVFINTPVVTFGAWEKRAQSLVPITCGNHVSMSVEENLERLELAIEDDGRTVFGVTDLDVTVGGSLDIGEIKGNAYSTVRLKGKGDVTLKGISHDAATGSVNTTLSSGGIKVDARELDGRLHLTENGADRGAVWFSGLGSETTIVGKDIKDKDDKPIEPTKLDTILYGGAGRDVLTLGPGGTVGAPTQAIAGNLEFFGGDGDDLIILRKGVTFWKDSDTYLNTGDGADVFSFDTHVMPSPQAAKLRINLGDNPGDILRVEPGRICLLTGSAGETSVTGIDILELGMGSEVYMPSSAISKEQFKLQGNGRFWIKSDQHGMDLSHITQGSSNRTQILVQAAAADSIVLGECTETVLISSPGTSGMVTISDFQEGMDRIFIAPDAAGMGLYQNQPAPGKLEITGGLKQVSLPGSVATYDEALAYAARELLEKATGLSAGSVTDIKIKNRGLKRDADGSGTTKMTGSHEVVPDSGYVSFDPLTNCKAAAGWFVFGDSTYIIAGTKALGSGETFGSRVAEPIITGIHTDSGTPSDFTDDTTKDDVPIGVDYIVRLIGTEYTQAGLAASVKGYNPETDSPVYLNVLA